MTEGERILATSRREEGTSEQPPGSNVGPRVNQYKATCPWLPANGDWPWCAAYDAWIMLKTWGKTLTVSPAVEDHAREAREHGLTVPVSAAKPGDAICLGGDHITRLAAPIAKNALTFQGLGGNQGNAVRVSPYSVARITTVISADKVARFLEVDRTPPKPRPKFVVVRDENGNEVKLATYGTARQAAERARRALRNGASSVTIRRRRP